MPSDGPELAQERVVVRTPAGAPAVDAHKLPLAPVQEQAASCQPPKKIIVVGTSVLTRLAVQKMLSSKEILPCVETKEEPYIFPNNPVAKSSTNVAAGATVCPSCGCPKGAGTVGQRATREIEARRTCRMNCRCHRT